MKEPMKAPDKITQKMTRDGAVAENLVTGEVENISQREPETELSATDSASAAVDLTAHVTHVHERRSLKKSEKAEAETVQKGSAARQRSSSRLQFSDEERADPTLQKYIRRSDKAADKLDKARDAIPTKKVIHRESTFDETTGKGKTRLRFEEVEKKPNGRLRQNLLSRPVQEIGAAAHNEVHKVEQENVGVEAGHKGEELAEQGIMYASARTRAALLHHRTKLWRDAAKAEQAAIKANADYLYQKALHDDPALAASNPVSRYLQKKRIQKNYAKDVRKAEKTAKNTAATAKSAAVRAKEAVKKTVVFVKKHSKVILIVVGIAAVMVMLLGGISSCSMMMGSGLGSVVSSSYMSEDADLQGAEEAYCDMEDELQEYLDTYEQIHDYDEYHYELDEIGHDPYVFLSILSALHEGTFTAADVEDDLTMLFEKQYILTETVTTETRYRTEIRTGYRTVTEPNTGQITLVPYQYEVEVPYTYYICTVELENFDLSHVPVYIMDEETLAMYAAYIGAVGNREDLYPDSDYVSNYITNPPADYEVPAQYLSDVRFAALLAEAEKYLGYPYVWGGSNPSTSFDCSGYVSWVLTNSGLCSTGRLGAQGLYNISTPVSSANVQPGDLVFFVGTYDTDGISHVGFYVGKDSAGNPMFLHCGDPIQYARLNTSYWQQHFYTYGRPPYN